MLKSIAYLFFPLPLSLEFLIVGITLCIFSKRKRLGTIFITISIVLLALLSNRIVAQGLVASLEDRYQSIVSTEKLLAEHHDIHNIVVLGGLLNYDSKLPVTSQLNAPMLIRLVEGVRLYHEIPGSKLILSGGGRYVVSEAEAMSWLAKSLGVKENDLILESESRSTYQEALNSKNLLGDQEFILVTSARHMPRAMLLFQKQGMKPIPASTNHLTRKDPSFEWETFIPRGGYIALSEEAFYEYLALIKEKVLGRID